MASKKFSGKFNHLEKICDFVTNEAKEAGLNEDSVYAVQLAVDEACSNIIEHAYCDVENGDIICECKNVGDGLEIMENLLILNQSLLPRLGCR